MRSALVKALSLPRCLGRAIRRHPAAALGLLLVLLAGMAAGLYVHALRQWQAAQAALKDGRPGDARRSLEVCLLLWPRSVPVHVLAARAARSGGDFEAAEKHLNHCIKLEGHAGEAVQLEFLLMRVQQGEVDAVAADLMSLVEEQHPETPLILETLARAHMHNLRYGPALYYLNRWVLEAPDDPQPLHWRGWVRERLSNYHGAIHDYEQALQRDPDRFPVRLRLAEMLLERANVPAALPHIDHLQERYPQRPVVMARVGQLRYLQGEKEEARRLLESAVRSMPNDAAVLIHLARLDLDDNRPARAEPKLRQVLEADPTDSEARYTLVKCLKLQGREKEADDMLAQYLRETEMLRRANQLLQREADRPSNDPDALCTIGGLFLHSRQERLGLYWLGKALQAGRARGQEHQQTHRILAEHYEKQGERDKAAVHRRWLGTSPAGRAAPSPTPASPGHPGPRPGH